MSDSAYSIIELVGSSDVTWENAAEDAIVQADENIRDLRLAEVKKMDMTIENGTIVNYRTRVALSFKYEDEN